MIYEIGTISTKANDPKITGKNTLWKNSVTKVSVGQIILIQSGNTIYQNSIRSVESDTQMTLSFPVPVALTDVKYVISITMIGSVSDGVNKATAMVTESYQLMMILNRLMTESGVIKVVLPDGTEMQLRTEKERDRLLDGKFDKSGGTVNGSVNATLDVQGAQVRAKTAEDSQINLNPASTEGPRIEHKIKGGTWYAHLLPNVTGTLMQVGDYGFGADKEARLGKDYRNCFVSYSDAAAANQDGWPSNGAGLQSNYASNRRAQIFINGAGVLYHRWSNAAGADNSPWKITVSSGEELAQSTSDMESHFKGSYSVSKIFRNTANTSVYSNVWAPIFFMKVGNSWNSISIGNTDGSFKVGYGDSTTTNSMLVYTTRNTTKDSNGNLKAASPVVKLFSDDIELNDESEGVEMEHLGVGHYLIKGVVGFNADGAWGINNGFVIPQDHNGKNMVLIDYEVRPDGDIEVFVFHQQNADMPERFQNKRIKHFDEEGVPVYFENYEPCDVPESRWIDMRVEMPPNSLYNQKQAEAERLAKIEAERLAQEEAKRAAEEAERAEQESFEGGNNSPL
ncbi:phage tail fiber protein [Providencia rettgeri]|uniref:phage tail fiber protein n=1 Tax=Providencia rettgeri TaxID=587 RepID=UPI00226E13E6|nr:hypothetical protein [Providencia rettgeri]MCX9115421.1 hypothetical protein [Providencia rettgeri]